MSRFGSVREKKTTHKKVKLPDGLHFICNHKCPHKMSDMECARIVENNLNSKGLKVRDIKLIEEDIKSIREHNNNRGICKCKIIDDSIEVKFCFCG